MALVMSSSTFVKKGENRPDPRSSECMPHITKLSSKSKPKQNQSVVAFITIFDEGSIESHSCTLESTSYMFIHTIRKALAPPEGILEKISPTTLKKSLMP